MLHLRTTSLEWREIGDEIVALDHDAGVYLATRGSGAVLWRALTQPTTRGSLVDALVISYGIDPAGAATDVDEFLEALAARNLLRS